MPVLCHFVHFLSAYFHFPLILNVCESDMPDRKPQVTVCGLALRTVYENLFVLSIRSTRRLMTWEKEEMKRAWRPVMLVDVWPVESLELPSNQLNRTWSTEFSFVFHRALNKTNIATWCDSLSFSVLCDF